MAEMLPEGYEQRREILDALDRLRQQINKSRATYVPGTPEKYPLAELRGLTILEAEALLAQAEQLREERDAAHRDVGNVALARMGRRAFHAEAEAQRLTKELNGVVCLAIQLHSMIPRQVWRDSGGDDGQGHYEGEYHAEKIRVELDALLAGSEAEPNQRTGRIIHGDATDDAWNERAFDQQKRRAEAAEAENRQLHADALAFDNVRKAFDDTLEANTRLREGLRFIAARRIALETFGLGNVADVADRALLADRPDGDCEHEWVSARNEAVLSGLICVKCHALAAEPDGAKPEGGEA